MLHGLEWWCCRLFSKYVFLFVKTIITTIIFIVIVIVYPWSYSSLILTSFIQLVDIIFITLIINWYCIFSLNNGITQENVRQGQLGQIKPMLPTSHISQPNVPMLDIVIGKPEIVFAIQDLVGVLAKEVSSILLAILEGSNLYIYCCILESCPNSCSGHGVCGTIHDITYFYGPDYNSLNTFAGDGYGLNYGYWDKYSSALCDCDTGYFGADCSLGNLLAYRRTYCIYI